MISKSYISLKLIIAGLVTFAIVRSSGSLNSMFLSTRAPIREHSDHHGQHVSAHGRVGTTIVDSLAMEILIPALYTPIFFHRSYLACR